MDTTTDSANLPLVSGDIHNTLDGRIIVGGQELAPGRYRLHGTDYVIEVADLGGESDIEAAQRYADEE